MTSDGTTVTSITNHVYSCGVITFNSTSCRFTFSFILNYRILKANYLIGCMYKNSINSSIHYRYLVESYIITNNTYSKHFLQMLT